MVCFSGRECLLIISHLKSGATGGERISIIQPVLSFHLNLANQSILDGALQTCRTMDERMGISFNDMI